METVDAWRLRKRAEIARLASLVTDPPDPGDLRDADEVTAVKLVLRSRIQAERLADPDLVETNRLEGESRRLEPYQVQWRYQRFDLAVKGPVPYPGLMDGRAAVWTTHFTTSGMGAIGPLLLAFQQRGEKPVVVLHRDAYFETHDALDMLVPRIKRVLVPSGQDLAGPAREARAGGADVVIVWVDSYSVDDPIGAIAKLAHPDADHVVIDTTCYEAGSPRIAALVDRAFEAGSAVTLVRSHLKLDGLGIEYGRLGSTVHMATPMLPGDRFEGYRWIKSVEAATSRLVGSYAVPAHLNPFMGDEEYLALNRTRIERMQANATRVGEGLQEAFAGTPVIVRSFHHRLFVSLGPWPGQIGEPRVRDVLDHLVGSLRDRGHAARLANSFGFDFVPVAPFRDPKTDVSHIRFGIPDWPDVWIDGLINDIVRGFCEIAPG